MSPLKKVLRVMGWVLATSWMYTYRDFKLVHREEWKEDEFLDFWIPHRQGELNFIGIVGSLVAAVVTGCLSLPGVGNATWIVTGFWYCTLIFSIFSVGLGFQQRTALNGLALGRAIRARRSKLAKESTTPPTASSSNSNISNSSTLTPYEEPLFQHPKMRDIMAWQAPVQLLTHALLFFLAGLLGFICEPLFTEEWGRRPKTAILVIMLFTTSISLYIIATSRIQTLVGRVNNCSMA